MLKLLRWMPCLLAPFYLTSALGGESNTDETQNVLKRFMGERASAVHIQCDTAQTLNAKVKVENNKINIVASDSVTAIRAVYTYVKNEGMGMNAWSGNRTKFPEVFPDTQFEISTPFKFRYYLNVVTYGYTTPYWDWARWEQEIDWMALHGLNMPLALVATEAIGERVWKRLGLTQAEIDEFYTGPAHLPWQRMGNITKHDGPLNANWHAGQIALQHKILKRLRALGMHPIAPGFAGFVPKGLKNHYPDIQLLSLSWAGFPSDKRGSILAPNTELFKKIGQLFIEEWEKEFGENDFYIADSFNEMELPGAKDEHQKLLSECGDAIYQSIRAGNPKATWVVQGWMFGYQRHIWTPENTQALFSKVPNDKVFILDEAFDYNATFWRNGMNYDLYKGYNGKQWGMGFIPNMGGKTGWTGIFSYYAKSVSEALNSPNRGNLCGYGLCPEGIENNEVLYEMLCDLPWQTTPIDVQTWIKDLCMARYGAYPQPMQEAWQIFFETCYGSFTDHPRLGWQHMGFGGTLHQSDKFMKGVELFLSVAPTFKNEPLYRNDAIDLAAAYLGIKANAWFALAKKAHDQGDEALRDTAWVQALTYLFETDHLLESHPNLKLSNWISLARSHGTTPEEQNNYEHNARRLVTVWGPPINDYSARMWSGLIRDFYAPRMNAYFDALKANQPFARAQWEEAWVMREGVTQVKPLPFPLKTAQEWVMKASNEKMPQINVDAGHLVGEWFPEQISTQESILEFDVPLDQLKASKRISFNFKQGKHRLEIKWVAIELDGDEVWRETRQGIAGTPSQGNQYSYQLSESSKGNNSCKIRMSVRTDGGSDSKGQVRLLK